MDNEETKTGEEIQDEGSPEPDDNQIQESEDEKQPESNEELTVTIDDGKEKEPEEQPSETEWLRDLRKSWKSYKKENRQLKQELEKIKEAQKPVATAAAPGPKPKLEDPGIDYDTDIYVQKVDEWHNKNRAYEDEQRKLKEEEAKQTEAWQKQLNRYGQRKKELPVKDFDDAEMIVEDLLNPTQQGIIVQGARNPELVVYALGKNPKRAAEIAAIKHPVNFAFAIANLEAQLKTSKRKVATQPEKTLTSTGAISGAVDTKLERLRREAEKTGDYSALAAYNRKKRRAEAAA